MICLFNINKDTAEGTFVLSAVVFEAMAEARAELAELERIKSLYSKAYKSTMNAVEARVKEVKNSQNYFV